LHLANQATAGTALEFKNYFPKLPETTRYISIYGVPLWGMGGEQIITISDDRRPEDKVPTMKKAQLIQEE